MEADTIGVEKVRISSVRGTPPSSRNDKGLNARKFEPLRAATLKFEQTSKIAPPSFGPVPPLNVTPSDEYKVLRCVVSSKTHGAMIG